MPNLPSAITTAVSKAQGRLKVDASSRKGKNKMVRGMVKKKVKSAPQASKDMKTEADIGRQGTLPTNVPMFNGYMNMVSGQKG